MIIKTFELSFLEEEIQKAEQHTQGLSAETEGELGKARWKHRRIVFVVGALTVLWGVALMVIGAVGLKGGGAWGFFFVLVGLALAIISLGYAGVQLLRSATHGSRKDPKELARSFMDEVMCQIDPDYSRALLLVSPAMIGVSTLENASKSWESLKQRIMGEVRKREVAACGACGREKRGLWSISSFDPYLQDEEYIRKEKLRYFQCKECGNAYCGPCFLGLKKEGVMRKRSCPSCGKKLDKSSHIFFTKPELEFKAQVREVTVNEVEEGRLVRVEARVEVNLKMNQKVAEGSGEKKVCLPLDERGQVTCHFRNSAIKTGEEWFLLGATPGREVSAEDPPNISEQNRLS